MMGKLKEFIKKIPGAKWAYRWLEIIVKRSFMLLCWLFPLQDKAVFCSHGGYYGGNPRALYGELMKLEPDWRYIWIMKDPGEQIDGAACVGEKSLKAVYHLATARLWVDDGRKRQWTVKRKGQFYVQTWHGDIMLKKVEKDVEENLNRDYVMDAKHDSRLIDVFLTGSRWMQEKGKAAFWSDVPTLDLGMPGNDVLFADAEQKEAVRRQVLDAYGLTGETRICLYVPTFRGDGQSDAYLTRDGCGRVLEALEARFGGEWVMLARLHPNVFRMQERMEYDRRVLNGNLYEVTNHLVVACDALITDYSSCMFDGALAGKRTLLYVSDLEAYTRERGFYFELEKLPFPMARSAEELAEKILAFDDARYGEALSGLLEDVAPIRSATASRDVAKYIAVHMEEIKTE